MDDVMSAEAAPKAKDRSRFAIFYERDAPSLDETGMMEYRSSEATAEGSQKLVEAGVLNGSAITQLFRHSGENGFSLVHVWFKANYHLPRHSHNVDCLYYIVGGQVIMGRQVLGVGDGFYIPEDHAYGYRAGPKGAEVLEFRHATSFDIKLDEKPEVFDRILKTVEENRDQWAADSVPPSRR
jgi:mannose-6-phosphate isomerase-like protein (cupin superfamily)